MATGTVPGQGKGHGVFSAGRAQIAEKTLRTDNWRASPIFMAVILGIFVVYSGVRLFMNDYYYATDEHYLTPMYSPCISEACVEDSSDFGTWLPDMGTGVPIAILVFPILTFFRATCYYYRKAGWRSFLLSPHACGVPEPWKKYTGESRFPLVLANWHRYFWMGACLLLLINTFDAFKAFEGVDGGIGMGLGTVIMWANLIALWMYSMSCHACRHILGGQLKHFSKHPVRYRIWKFISLINPKHGDWALISLFTVIATDAYIMAVSAGWFSDFRFFN